MTLDELRALATNTRNGFQCWPAPYQMSPTLEDCEMLYALVRVTKPAVVVELGTGRGVSARFIGEALAANDLAAPRAVVSTLHTFEPSEEYRTDAGRLIKADLPVLLNGGDLLADFTHVDLVFIDSDYTRRTSDIDEWLGGDYDGLVVVHDANRRYPGLEQGRGVFLPGSDGLWIGRAGG